MSRIDEVLAVARARIVRYTPADAWAADDVLIVDLRADDVRTRTGTIPGSVHVPRSVLEWRCDPSSGYTNPALTGRRLILVCEEGYSSSLAAAALRELGVDAGDLEGGYAAWAAAGLPTRPCVESTQAGLPGMGGPE
jgi:rhodanese-related sulfurtransferase